jgi:hypothetical protein
VNLGRLHTREAGRELSEGAQNDWTQLPRGLHTHLRQPESTQAWWDEKKSYMASHGWKEILCGLHWFAIGIKWLPEVFVWKWSGNSKNNLDPCGEKTRRWIVLSFPHQLPFLRTSFCCQSPVVWRGSYKVVRVWPRVFAKVHGRPVERHYSLVRCSTNNPLNWPIREGPT